MQLQSYSTVLLVTLLLRAVSPSAGSCSVTKGKYRDCTCGLLYRDVVQQCSDEHTIFEPELSLESLANESCPFQCANGGKLASDRRGCECAEGFSGLCCEIESLGCGGTYFAPRGVFATPLYPNRYPNNVNCVWKISTSPGRRIALGVKDNAFEVQSGYNIWSCNYDWVAVYDGNSKSGRRIGSFCGNDMRKFQTIQSTGRHLYIQFKSNWQVRKMGFQLQYETFPESESCGRMFFSHPVGIVTSPQYPLPYGPNTNCGYIIKVKPNHDVVLTVREISVTATADCSTGDRIIVGKRVGKKLSFLTLFCGHQTRLIRPYTVRGAEFVVLQFTSDHLRDGRFKILYEQIPRFR